MSIVKICCIFILGVSCFRLLAQSSENQMIHLQHQHQTLKAVFGDISKQTGWIFTYSDLDDQQKVTIRQNQIALKDALSALSQQTGAEFILRDKYIIVKPGRNPMKKEVEISGIIFDEKTRLPLSKASVYIKSSKSLMNTDQEGRFKMKLKSDRQWATLSVAKLNYDDTTVVVSMNHPGPVNIYLKGYNRQTIEELYPLVRKEPVLGVHDTLLPDSIPILSTANQKGFWEQLEIEKPDFGNISEDFFNSISFSLIPPISTNKMLSYHTTNNLAINVIGGHSAGVNGLELGGVYNYTRGNVNGIQVAGILNRVSGSHTGIQVAGILNSNSGNSTGMQVSGLINYNADTLTGIQLSGFYQEGNVINGLQVAGFYNNADTLTGGQVAGFYNQCGTIKGAQISGFLNYADTLEGLQLGIINISKYTRAGVGIGLFNYAGNGYHKIEMARNSERGWQLGFRSGWHALYLHYFGGVNHHKPDTTFLQAGFGLASSLPLSKTIRLELDANVRTQRLAEDFGNWSFNFQNQALIGLSWQPFRKLGIKTGLTLNHFWYDPADKANLSFAALTGKSIYDYKEPDFTHKMWWGWQVSVLFL